MVLVWLTFIGAAVALRRNKLTGIRSCWRNGFLPGHGGLCPVSSTWS